MLFNCSAGSFFNLMKNAGILRGGVTMEEFYQWASVKHTFLSGEDWVTMRKVLGQDDEKLSKLLQKVAHLESINAEGSEAFLRAGAGGFEYHWKSNKKTAITQDEIQTLLKQGIHVFTGVTVLINGKKPAADNFNNDHYLVLAGVNYMVHEAVVYSKRDPWKPLVPVYSDPAKAGANKQNEALDSISHPVFQDGVRTTEENYHAFIEIRRLKDLPQQQEKDN